MWLKYRRAAAKLWCLLLSFAAGMFFCCGQCWADAIQGAPEATGSAGDAARQEEGSLQTGRYQTPLAGEARGASFLGYQVDLPALDRGHMTSFTFGGSILDPKQGGTLGVPVAALWLRRVEPGYRSRDLVSIFDNELEYDRRLGDLELVGRWENFTLPTAQTELVQNREIKATSVTWGTVLGSLGPGLRLPVAPFQIDNDLRVQLLGRAGYFYAQRNSDTGPSLRMPPDTLLYGAKLRVRYDNLRRNLLELPHRGFATGFDLDYLSRDRWRDPESGASIAPGNRDYLQVTGYFVGAGGIPGLSERDRVVCSLYGGTTAENRGDRYNAFHINGGPFPSEADDLPRPHYTGLVFDDILANKYAEASLGYRRELAFFIYLSLIGSYLWADRASALDTGQVVFKETAAVSSTVSLDTAFFWNSEIYGAYAWDSGVIRQGRCGNGYLVIWSKLF